MTPTIIFVDDDRNIREGLKRILRQEPYRVLILESAQQCVDILAVTDVQVLITDLEMPGFNGRTLLNYFKDTMPEVVRIVLSGKLTRETSLDLINNNDVFRCLEKPCLSTTLLSAVHEALDMWQAQALTVSELPQASIVEGESQLHNGPSSASSLIGDALREVERLEKSLREHSEREINNLPKRSYVKN